ncbi:MAG: hypothetical protein IIT78_03435 [Mycoplasmataceae bacterium]|nr:hypothetical protein [Mycoplasmataceae bacterium]
MDNQNLNKEDFIFQFKDIQNYIENLQKNVNDKTSINKNKDNITIKELTVFKEFAQKYLFQFNVGKEAKEIDFNNWWFCSGITLKNLTLNKDKKNKQNKPLIFRLKDINTVALKDCKDENLKKEINKFKDFATRYLLNSSNNEKEFDNWTFSPQSLKINDLNNDLYDEDEIDILFINEDYFNHTYFFLVEIKDFSDSELIISKYWDYRNALVKIKRKDLNLESYIFSLLNKNCTFIRINIFKWDKQTFKQQYYKFNHEKSGDFFDYPTNNWIKIEEQEIKNIFQSSHNICLKDNNFHDYIRQFHSEDYLDKLLNNWKDENYISNVLVSNVNFNDLNQISNVKNYRITVINGIPGSGKTVFAFLLFITEKHVLFIITNISSYEYFKNNEFVKKIEAENKSKIVYLWDFLEIGHFYIDYAEPYESLSGHSNIDWSDPQKIIYIKNVNELNNYNMMLIDEYNNLNNEILYAILKEIKFLDNKRVFLFGDYLQDIYCHYHTILPSNNSKKYKDLCHVLDKYYPNKHYSLDWKTSNRFNNKDLSKLQYISFGNDDYLKKYKKSELQSFINIELEYTNKTSNQIDAKNGEKIIVLQSSNNIDSSIFTQFSAAGCEHEKVIVYLNSRINFKDEHFNYEFSDKKVQCSNFYDPTETWLYEALTRATRSVKILIYDKNKFAKEIYNCISQRIKQLENNDTKN